MAEIISFQPRPRLDRNIDLLPAGGAKIMFFTGVRYVRAETEADRPNQPAGGGKASGGRARRRRA